MSGWEEEWSDVPPVDIDTDRMACPVCGAGIVHTGTHDESDGEQTYAVPDVYRCEMDCGYQHVE